jgi:hypothetical protein
MANKKSAKKAAKKAVKKPITIKLHKGYTLEDLRCAITERTWKALSAEHKHHKKVTINANVIPPKPPVP